MTSAGSDAAMPTPMTPADANAPTGGHIGAKSDGFAARGRDLLDHCVDPVRAPRSQYNLCSSFCEKPRGAFPNAAAGSGDDDDLVGDI
jgi:hypothetical protein